MIVRTIGQGGMGAVYQARDLRRQIICAIKEMSLSMVPPEEREQAVQNFKAEANMLASLNHPNLPTFTGFFTEGSRHFLVMEYIDGITLEELLERNGGPFPERRVLGWARQLCDVLEYLHSQRSPIIFRDMKPGNIMLMRNGRIKLIDFGIARFFRHASSQDTQMLGTPGFAPPEQYGKAQTDERSDIYSLAITLFQLMTNTLSEKGFGLKDVRSVNPNISTAVARALEKAASLSPENRYENVEAFRRALLGVGTFIFESGDQATTAEELAEVCASYPDEAADYLFAGEIESWLREIGASDLARAAMHIRATISDPEDAVERFLQVVMGPSAHIRHYTTTMVDAHSATIPPSAHSQGSHGGRGWLSRGPTSDVIVQPQTIDFGQVYPGISAPMSLSISGNKGAFIQGTISPIEPWILLDATSFDGMSTRVNVRVNSTRLRGSTQYTGKILVSPDGSGDDDQDITVKVLVDVLGYTATRSMPSRGGNIQGAPVDDEDEDEEEEDTLIAGQSGMAMVPPQSTLAGPAYNNAKYEEYKAKYGQPGTGSSASSGWDPLQASSRQQQSLQRGLTFFAAFMVASLCYTVLSQLPFLAHKPILPPNPAFIFVLLSMLPAATLGALLVSGTWSSKDIINRVCTGLSSALLALGLSEFVWQNFLHLEVPSLQLVVMLLAAATGATVGINPLVSDLVLEGATWAMTRMRLFIIAVAVVVGGCLGFFLTVGFALSWFTPLSILLGIGLVVTLVLRVDWLIKQNYP